MPDEISDAFLDALNQKSFGKLGPLPDDTQLGWVGPRHVFETEIAAEHVSFGRFAHAGLRVDRLRAPANVLKSYVQIEKEAALQVAGREYLSRGELKNARQRAVDRAEAEARSGSFRRISAYPVLIDLSDRTVYLGNTSPTLADKLMQLFNDTFGCALEPGGPERVALRLLSAARNEQALDKLTPFRLVHAPEGFDGDDARFERDLSYLGKEFLTWLWFQTDRDAGPLRVQTGDEVTVMLDRTLALKCDFGLTGSDVINCDGPTRLPEARSALRIGKQPTRAGLIVGGPLGEFRFTLDGPRWTLSSLALPESEADRGERERVEQRFELVADAAALIDALFDIFLQKRSGRAWEGELREMRAWASGTPTQTALPMPA